MQITFFLHATLSRSRHVPVTSFTTPFGRGVYFFSYRGWASFKSRSFDDDTCTLVDGRRATWMMYAMLNVFLFQVLICRPKRVIGELALRDR